MFYAGFTAYGCFIGTRKIASISSGISESELESTVNGYFTLDNIHGANDRIVQFMDGLALPQVYRHPDGLLHTSRDGQKGEVAVDALHASYSFKYFGQEQGSASIPSSICATTCRILSSSAPPNMRPTMSLMD